jgi:hypothetical protein
MDIWEYLLGILMICLLVATLVMCGGVTLAIFQAHF